MINMTDDKIIRSSFESADTMAYAATSSPIVSEGEELGLFITSSLALPSKF